jgi:6-oxo-cyclohex-1-ene-carbonyl-CoA hydrolase
LKRGTIDLSLLDAEVDSMATRLAMTMPDCLTKTIESLRRHKLMVWDRNREGNRAWLALNMMTEAHAGFRAFNEGDKDHREVDFLELRRRLARGEKWGEALIDAVQPRNGVRV